MLTCLCSAEASLEVDRVIAGGRMMVVKGEPIVSEQSLEASNRLIKLRGKKHYQQVNAGNAQRLET